MRRAIALRPFGAAGSATTSYRVKKLFRLLKHIRLAVVKLLLRFFA